MSTHTTTRDKVLSRMIVTVFAVAMLMTALSGWLSAAHADPDIAAEMTNTSTELYIKEFNVEEYELRGSDYSNPRYSLSRLDKPLNEIDITYDYDFELLNRTYDRLSNIDRPRALAAIFGEVTTGCESELQKHLAVLEFLHKISYHNLIQPMHEDGQAVFDPLVLLELNEMRCGAIARIGVDLYQAVGYPARLVQMAHHVTAELFYDDTWHLLEGDLAGGRQTVIVDGVIPSVNELSHNPYLIDAVPTHLEYYASTGPVPSTLTYPSYFYFSKSAYTDSLVEPQLYYKILPSSDNRNYGWDRYETVTDLDRILSAIPRNYELSPPQFTAAVIEEQTASISWRPPQDPSGALAGYFVYISSHSREWHYSTFIGNESAREYWQGGWEPDMYDALFQVPPHDLALITTTDTSIDIPLGAGETKYVTVVAFDKHGESVGRELYYSSVELKFSGSPSTGGTQPTLIEDSTQSQLWVICGSVSTLLLLVVVTISIRRHRRSRRSL